MKHNKIYITDNQLSLINIALMSMTRDDTTFNFGVDNGVFTEDDIYVYIETIGKFVKHNKGAGFILNKAEPSDINEIISSGINLWGNPIVDVVNGIRKG